MMRHFAVVILLLLLEMSVEARKREMIPICSDMFNNPKVSNRQCKAACLKKKKCPKGYCKVKGNRPRCLCLDCPGHKRKNKKKKQL
ncbi:unnamed protein product [Cylicocyclus nassatus]|uniref:Uncharacterized protein n=1 Tax=Cylicocyclus nassatus TaxID=53992 RepID=A0AA36HCK3_CYLNA|nr:unnamed protein product [Cylicocyclus nassatus]